MAKEIPMLTVCSVAAIVLMFGSCILASPDPLKCEFVKCPPMSEISCPEDSQLREYIDLSSTEITNDTSGITEELLNECCVARKCSCKLCNIPSCHNNSQVVYEVIPETQIPGKCCGQYDCRAEPNCTDIHPPDGFWLIDCQRCKCVYGERMCHRSCDEIIPNPTASYCKSKNLNMFYSHGDTWKDGCYDCECQNGEEKCMLPFCRSINCPPEKQVKVEGDCCPICWPDTDYYEGEDTENHHMEVDYSSEAPLANPIIIIKPTTSITSTPKTLLALPASSSSSTPSPATTTSSSTSTSTTTSTTSTTTTPSPPPPPCVFHDDPPATYAVYPEVVEVVHPANDHNVLYIIIGLETILLVILSVIIYHMRARKHSYNTVSHFDDNFNNCQKTSLKIEKMAELI